MTSQIDEALAKVPFQVTDPERIPAQRYYDEARRLLGVLDRRLAGRDWICGEYSIADIATAPWVRNLRHGYDAAAETGLEGFAEVIRWLETWDARPAVQRGLTVCAQPD